MRILRIRSGFQADHSSSSYLFYAIDGQVSAAGQRVAHRFSSRAEVDEQFARYLKWGESELSSNAYSALLGEHYDVMASESYDSWTLMIAVPKTPQMQALLRPFHDLDDGDFVRLDVHDYGKRLAIELFCEFDYDGPVFSQHEDPLEELVELLAEIRGEILQSDVSFLQGVAEFYGAGADEEDVDAEPEQPEPPEGWTKSELQQECLRRGITFRKSWTKEQLRQALTAGSPLPVGPARGGKAAQLSRAARRIVDSLEHR
jgi:hypothetical protein